MNKKDEVSKITTRDFPYLDPDFLWNDYEELELHVHWKANKKPKYMNKWISHTNTNLNAIPSGIFNRFTKLTSMTDKPAQMKIDER